MTTYTYNLWAARLALAVLLLLSITTSQAVADCSLPSNVVAVYGAYNATGTSKVISAPGLANSSIYIINNTDVGTLNTTSLGTITLTDIDQYISPVLSNGIVPGYQIWSHINGTNDTLTFQYNGTLLGSTAVLNGFVVSGTGKFLNATGALTVTGSAVQIPTNDSSVYNLTWIASSYAAIVVLQPLAKNGSTSSNSTLARFLH